MRMRDGFMNPTVVIRVQVSVYRSFSVNKLFKNEKIRKNERKRSGEGGMGFEKERTNMLLSQAPRTTFCSSGVNLQEETTS